MSSFFKKKKENKHEINSVKYTEVPNDDLFTDKKRKGNHSETSLKKKSANRLLFNYNTFDE
jgi:hypothetical protein